MNRVQSAYVVGLLFGFIMGLLFPFYCYLFSGNVPLYEQVGVLWLCLGVMFVFSIIIMGLLIYGSRRWCE